MAAAKSMTRSWISRCARPDRSSHASPCGRLASASRRFASTSVAGMSSMSSALGNSTGNASDTLRLMNSGEPRYQAAASTAAPAAAMMTIRMGLMP